MMREWKKFMNKWLLQGSATSYMIKERIREWETFREKGAEKASACWLCPSLLYKSLLYIGMFSSHWLANNTCAKGSGILACDRCA